MSTRKRVTGRTKKVPRRRVVRPAKRTSRVTATSRRATNGKPPRRVALPAAARRRTRRPPRRLLAVDVGNSETVVGVIRGTTVEGFWRLTSVKQTGDEVLLQLRTIAGAAGLNARGLGAALSSVAPALTAPWLHALEQMTGEVPLEIGHRTARTLPIRYHDPSSVGADRIANAMAARELYGAPAIVVDLGTSTNFDCVSQGGAYLGGVLAPGVASSAEELFRRAARIPRVELRRPARALGRTTAEAVQSGVVWGSAGLVDAIVKRLTQEMKGDPQVIATGGLAALIAPECETVQHVDEGLTLKGMALVWEENR